MELTGKQRARLRGMANGLDCVIQIGKDGIGENLLRQTEDVLDARELVKGRVLDNSLQYDARSAAEELAQAVHAQVVQVIGSVFVLYRESRRKPKEQQLSLDGKAAVGGKTSAGKKAPEIRKPASGGKAGRPVPSGGRTRSPLARKAPIVPGSGRPTQTRKASGKPGRGGGRPVSGGGKRPPQMRKASSGPGRGGGRIDNNKKTGFRGKRKP